MRVLIAPAEFKGSLTASAAARAMASGWASERPSDEIDICPLSDGGPGFVDAMAGALGGRLESATIRGPHGDHVPGAVLIVGDVAYVESAQACGLHLVDASQDPRRASTYGVGELISVARDAGASTVYIGLGGSATTDGGAGLLAALGATADADLESGGLPLVGIQRIDLAPAREAVRGLELIVASDVDNPLLGLTGAAKVFGEQKGLATEDIFVLDRALADLATAVGKTPAGKDPAIAKGAGAGGGVGFALLSLGATRVAGISTVSQAVDLRQRIQQSDLVITGEGCFDWQSMSGKVVTGVASTALPVVRPCVVLAGQVMVGRREYSAIGISAAYSASDIVGSVEHAMSEPVSSLEESAARVARTWGIDC